MKNIRKIFCSDIKHLCTNFFALVIAIGLCALPALYAWFNIYANWDPYANTANIKIGVASLDKGYTSDDGEYTNMGDQVVDQLKEATSIGWVFVDTEEEAVEGVNSGDYYAAVVIDADFSSSMYTALSDNFKNPRITYYENEKKNAVATKITDTAVSTLQQSINEQFIQVVTSKVFETTNGVSEELSEASAFDEFENKLKTMNENLEDYNAMVTEFIEGNAALTAAVGSASDSMAGTREKMKTEDSYINKATNDLSSTKTSLQNFSTQVNSTMASIQTSINNISTDIDSAGLANDAKSLDADMTQAAKDASQATTDLNALTVTLNTMLSDSLDNPDPASKLTDDQRKKIQDTLDTASTMLEWMQTIQQTAGDVAEITTAQDTVKTTSEAAKKMLSTCNTSIANISNMYTNSLVPQMNTLLDTLNTVLTNATDMLNSLDNALGDMDIIFDGIVTTVDSTNDSLEETSKIIQTVNDRLTTIIDGLDSVSDDERAQKLVELLAGDPELYSEFFAEPVNVNTNEIYPVENYGSAVTPFYTVLAIWVGAIFLVSLFKVKADPTKLDNPKSWQLFLGRYLLFFLLGQIQALIIVLGDIYLLGVQCLHPVMFWAVASISSFTFSLLIYALTISFGDIGKALVVVMVVIQIAGSSGTYPIEMLPTFYRRVYIFFPFPYAINAMRECIAGMYENTYGTCLMQLLVFAVAALVIGLVIRIPFVGLNHFVEERMEDTKMM